MPIATLTRRTAAPVYPEIIDRTYELWADLIRRPMTTLVPRVVELSETMTDCHWLKLLRFAERASSSNAQAARVHVTLRHMELLTH